jgi:hypothetical protein
MYFIPLLKGESLKNPKEGLWKDMHNTTKNDNYDRKTIKKFIIYVNMDNEEIYKNRP